MMWAYLAIVLAVAVGAFYAGRWCGMEWTLSHCVMTKEEDDESTN